MRTFPDLYLHLLGLKRVQYLLVVPSSKIGRGQGKTHVWVRLHEFLVGRSWVGGSMPAPIWWDVVLKC